MHRGCVCVYVCMTSSCTACINNTAGMHELIWYVFWVKLLLLRFVRLLQDGVSMDEVVDCSTAALHLMARDPYNRLIMRQLNVIPTFIQVSLLAHVFSCY